TCALPISGSAVERRLAAAHHEHVPALHQRGTADARRVHDTTREAFHALDGGNRRQREDAVADDDVVEVQVFLALAGANRHLPAGTLLRHFHHFGPAPDTSEDAEPLR